ncbi:bifunctional DedA family/phosphatase PAP2 family protein [Litoribacillus peritrichatus]
MSLDQVLDWLNQNPEWFLFTVFLTAFSESLAVVGLIMPGAFLMFALMVMAGNQEFPLMSVLVWSFIGAVLGDAISFYFGRVFKNKIPNTWPFSKKPEWLEQSKAFFNKHGGKSIFIGRFVGPVRPLIPMVAGMLSMPSGRFLAVNVISAIGWAICYVLPGYIIGSAMRLDIDLPENFRTVFFTTVILVICFIALTIWAYQNLHPERSAYQHMQYVFKSNRTLATVWHRLSAPRTDEPTFPLTSLLTFVVCTLFFLSWIFWVDYAPHPLLTDNALLELSKQVYNESSQKVFVAITMLGDPNLLYFCAGWFAIYLTVKRQYSAMILIGCVTAVSYFSVHFLKEAFGHPRPELLIEPLNSFAFPSGHTTGATVYFGLIAAFIAQETEQHKRWPIYAIGLTLAIVVGFSRIFLGVHWFSDVLGGLLLGFMIVALARVIYSPFNQHSIKHNKTDIWLPIALVTTYLGYYGYEYTNQLTKYAWLDIFSR